MSTYPNEPDEQRKVRRRAAQYIVGLIEVTHGRTAADHWAWERTPMPVGLPSDEQLGQGLRIALSPRLNLSISERMARSGGGCALAALCRARELAAVSSVTGMP